MVAAKRAGYSVSAIDAFADKQTLTLADKVMVVAYDKHGFNAAAMLSAVNAINVKQYVGFIYGSGFEAQPELLLKLAQIIPLIGNAASNVQAVKTTGFFAVLDALNIKHPNIYEALPVNAINHGAENGSYLKKFAGGCGGTHISVAETEQKLASDHYFQQHISGLAVSLLFIADGKEIVVIGFNEQWLNPTKTMPYRYGGAVGNIALPIEVQQQLIEAAQKITRQFGLTGLNSLDAIIQKTALQGDIVYVLEINPRLSATVDLYEDLNLIDAHVQTVLMHSLKDPKKYTETYTEKYSKLPASIKASKQCKAQAIVYAEFDMQLPTEFDWPDWVVDTPCKADGSHIKILATEPICTVNAHAKNADDAKQLAQSRVKILLAELAAHF